MSSGKLRALSPRPDHVRDASAPRRARAPLPGRPRPPRLRARAHRCSVPPRQLVPPEFRVHGAHGVLGGWRGGGSPRHWPCVPPSPVRCRLGGHVTAAKATSRNGQEPSVGSLAPEGPVGAHAAARHGHVTALATLAEAAGPWPLVPPRPARPAPRGSPGGWPSRARARQPRTLAPPARGVGCVFRGLAREGLVPRPRAVSKEAEVRACSVFRPLVGDRHPDPPV